MQESGGLLHFVTGPVTPFAKCTCGALGSDVDFSKQKKYDKRDKNL